MFVPYTLSQPHTVRAGNRKCSYFCSSSMFGDKEKDVLKGFVTDFGKENVFTIRRYWYRKWQTL